MTPFARALGAMLAAEPQQAEHHCYCWQGASLERTVPAVCRRLALVQNLERHHRLRRHEVAPVNWLDAWPAAYQEVLADPQEFDAAVGFAG